MISFVPIVALLYVGGTAAFTYKAPEAGVCLARPDTDTFWVNKVDCHVSSCHRSSYVFSETKLNWEDARRDCEKNNMELAVILTKDEDDYLKKQVLLHAKGRNTDYPGADGEAAKKYQNMYWIGGRTNSAESKDWVYPRPGIQMSEAKVKSEGWGWAADRPNAFNTQHCVTYFSEIDFTKIAGWDNDDCSFKYHYICESIPRCHIVGEEVKKC